MFNIFSILLPDLLHEFEIGTWRALFIHLLRILQSIDGGLLTELDRRYVYLRYNRSRSDPLISKFSGNTIIWQGYNSTFFGKLFRNEKDGSS